MAKAAKVKVRVSAQPVVVMEAEVARKIRQHARGSMKAEVCGVLIGNTEHERMTIEACIPGINAAQGGAHVTFTQDTWEHIYKIKDKEYPEQKIVGWYHSHPGFGVFLSEHDLFIQQNFFSNAQQVAWVYDPHTDEEGCFGWIGDRIEKLTSMRVGYTQSVKLLSSEAEPEQDEPDPQLPLDQPSHAGSQEPAWVAWTARILAYLSAALLGFILSYVFFPRVVVIPISPDDPRLQLPGPQGNAFPSPRTDPLNPAETTPKKSPETAAPQAPSQPRKDDHAKH